MRIGIANDHSGVALKKALVAHLESLGHEVINFGTDSEDSVDYPNLGYELSGAVRDKGVELGVAICGTGIGISLACNKVKGIRCAVCSDAYSARMARCHNDANIIALGSRVIGEELAKLLVSEFVNNEFEGGRHQRRVALISAIEEKENV